MIDFRWCVTGVLTVLLVGTMAGCGGDNSSSSPTAPTSGGFLTEQAGNASMRALGVCAVTASEAMLPPTFTVVTIPEGDPLHGIFNKCMKTFGISHLAAAGYPDATLVHSSTVTAEYLDNDENGIPDNAAVNRALQANHASLIHISAAGGYNDWGSVRDRQEVGYIKELTLMWAPNGSEYESVRGGTWCGRDCGQPGDGEVLEHIPELIQKAGYAYAYPNDFGGGRGTTFGLAMDTARGGYFAQSPGTYPSSAWYVLDDAAMPYGGFQVEYFFWGLATYLGMLGDVSPGVCADLAEEWTLCTRAEFIATDTKFHAILNSARFNFPRRAPNGSYR